MFAESADELLQFHIDAQSKTYENIRCKTKHTWYFGEIEVT